MNTSQEYAELPKFGTSKNEYETTVRSFYEYWQTASDEEIRALVSFVRKRDKRDEAYNKKLEAQTTTTSDEDHMDDFYCCFCNETLEDASSYRNHELSKRHRDNVEPLEKVMNRVC